HDLDELDLSTFHGGTLSASHRSFRLSASVLRGEIEAELGEDLLLGGSIENEINYDVTLYRIGLGMDFWEHEGPDFRLHASAGLFGWKMNLSARDPGYESLGLIGGGILLAGGAGWRVTETVTIGAALRVQEFLGDAVGPAVSLSLGAEIRF
ncbi:MAG: hypothetical protein ACYTAF_16695, partial [Planctomycetota bacterium]